MDQATPWVEMLRQGVRLGLSPDGFWRLSVREWRMLTEATAGSSMGRETFERLARSWPDNPPS